MFLVFKAMIVMALLSQVWGEEGPGQVNPCILPPESGNCFAYIPSFYYDSSTGTCKDFVYGGCGGNDNRFSSIEDCLQSCGGTVKAS